MLQALVTSPVPVSSSPSSLGRVKLGIAGALQNIWSFLWLVRVFYCFKLFLNMPLDSKTFREWKLSRAKMGTKQAIKIWGFLDWKLSFV